MKNQFCAWTAAVALFTTATFVSAQQPSTRVPSAPAPALAAPQAPAQATPQPVTFPPVDPKNFTAPSPTVDEVNAFLKALWGYDQERVWSVSAILTTPAPGVSKVVIFVAEKNQPARQTQTTLFITPDGKHAIAENVISFGPKPYAEARAALQARANGPARGAKDNELLLVEFTDLQCARCREAQDIMDNLLQDFPQARVIVQEFPIPELHPYAFRAAAEGVCVRKAKGDEAFFAYQKALFASQSSLTKAEADTTLAAAVAKSGADAAAAAACAETAEAKNAVDASVKLGTDIGVNDAPVLAINGRLVPLTGLPYEWLKRIIAYQANQDGVQVTLQPSLRTLK